MKELIYNNMNPNGGGLAVNITGRYESNRHALARMEKITFGEAAARLRKKRGGGHNISADELIRMYRAVHGEPEWHHAGFMPKKYGGGMKKTYFLPQYMSNEQFIALRKQYSRKLVQKLINKMAEEQKAIDENKKREMRLEFLKNNNIERFTRISESKLKQYQYTHISDEEMSGKYGWFEADSKYNLPVYYSGYIFNSKEQLDQFLALL